MSVKCPLPPLPPPQLRAAAETRLANSPAGEEFAQSDKKLLHELQVHQIELEMQNEALIEAHIALEESRDRFVDFYEFAPVGYLTITDRGLIADINSTGASLLVAERKQLLLKPFARVVNPADADRYRSHFLAALKTDEKLTCELALLRGDGAHICVRLDSLRLIKDGQTPALRVVLTDITERKLFEAELEKHRNHLEERVSARTSELAQSRDAAEAGNRAKGIFLANMSHELRTPMNGVVGMIDLGLSRATDPQQIDWLNKCKGAAQRMASVVNDILDFSKIEAERLQLEEKSFSLTRMIDDAIAMHDIVAEAKGLNLTRKIPVTFPDQLSSDAFRLRQILLNFLGNACKFSDKGTITVRVSAVEQDGESVLIRIEVEDHGIGISPEQQAMLFQAFSQVDGSMTRKHGGSGLGLIISKRLANLMGGDVGMVSQEGQGSTFWATARLKTGKASKVGI
ncbi:MAG: ATP-binding protein [Sulfuritalea sp.]|nr:ATP-binding protein [Sulfuritalea sp.]